MGNYLIFIGGSGARAYKAFLHCCAAGLIQEDVSVLLMDADKTNGAVSESIDVYKFYQKHHEWMTQAEVQDRCIFKSEVKMYGDGVVSPMRQGVSYLDQVAEENPDRKRVLKWFYKKEEREQPLDNGFYARPNIGCVFFQNFQKQEYRSLISEINAELDREDSVNIQLIGSVFGGTGAAGIPSVLRNLYKDIAQHIGNEGNFRCSGVLITPYFKVTESKVKKDGLIIDSRDFELNTIEALKYYRFYQSADINQRGHFHSLYLVGQKQPEVVNKEYADGGSAQKNNPHIVELYAALAIGDFLKNPKENGIKEAIIDKEEIIKWSELPDETDKLANMARAEVIYENDIFSYINEHKVGKRKTFDVAQWYKAYQFQEGANRVGAAEMYGYAVCFLKWIYWLQNVILEDGTERRKQSVHLFGKILKQVKNQIDDETGDEKDKRQKRTEIRERFNDIVDTCSNIEFVIEKATAILTVLGRTPGKTAAVCSCGGLLLKLFQLTRKK